MVHGEIKRERMLRALLSLGGQPRSKGGETIIWFPGTTVIVGRRHFSIAMLRRVERKLAAAGIVREDLHRALERR